MLTQNIKSIFIIYIFCLLLIILYSCDYQSEEEIKNEIQKVLFQQQDSWNNGDIEAFMQGYWKSDSLKFIGQKNINYGWQTTLENFIKKYPDKSTMGELTFKIITLDIFSSQAAYMIGTWALKREIGDISGYFSLVWKKIDGKWVITSDHTP